VRSSCFAGIWLAAGLYAAGQEYDLPGNSFAEPATLSKAMATLAGQVITAYKETDREQYLDNLFRLQTIAGRYADVLQTLVELRKRRATSDADRFAWLYLQYEVYASAMGIRNDQQVPFEEAFKRSFRETFSRLDDRAATAAIRLFGTNQTATFQQDLRDALDRQKTRNTISLTDAVVLLKKYQMVQAYQSFEPLSSSLIEKEDQRRYLTQEDIPVRTKDGATVAVMVVRSRAANRRLPALLLFTIYARRDWSFSEARLTAAHGYAGVVAYTRGKGISPDAPVPYEHDGDDAADVINWISTQNWSDGRVGMYGGSYCGFAQWAAAKHLPPALKALMPSATVSPGIDVPMEGNIFQNFVYPWPLYTTSGKLLDEENYNDKARWRGLNHKWYSSGQPYREMDRVDGTPNPFFRRWLAHPSYDQYWQRMIPYGKEFTKINIPVLTTDGYFDGGLIGALYYFTEQHKYNPRAEHYLVVGPYDHLGSQYGSVDVLQGYAIDPAARIDFRQLRYQWFDHVFKAGPKPALLQDKVNYEVLGGNEWKHAPSLDAMANGSLRYYLTATRLGEAFLLSSVRPTGAGFIEQKIDFADRSDVDRTTSDLLVNQSLDTNNGLAFVSGPLEQPTEISGLFSGQLNFITNKKDFDVDVQLYELMPNRDYLALSYYMARASYARNRSRRRLLTPGQRQQLNFTSGRPMSCKMPAGSRLVVVLSVIKQPDIQINYGTGKDVSDESIQDAKVPLEVKWFSDSFVSLPVWK